MRIVSQNKKVDVNYNNISLQLINERDCAFKIYAIDIINDAHGTMIGEYLKKEKALKVMKMIRDPKLRIDFNKTYELKIKDYTFNQTTIIEEKSFETEIELDDYILEYSKKVENGFLKGKLDGLLQFEHFVKQHFNKHNIDDEEYFYMPLDEDVK